MAGMETKVILVGIGLVLVCTCFKYRLINVVNVKEALHVQESQRWLNIWKTFSQIVS